MCLHIAIPTTRSAARITRRGQRGCGYKRASEIAFRFFFLPPPPPLLSLLSAPRHMSIFVHSTTHATLYAMFRASPPSIDRALLPSFMPTFSPPSSFSSLLLFSHSVLSPQQSISRAFKTGILDTTHTSLRRIALETDTKTRNKENNKGWPCSPLFCVITLSFSLSLHLAALELSQDSDRCPA